MLATLTDSPLDNSEFRWRTGQDITVAGIPTRALRINYVGELGWELHPAMADLPALYDAVCVKNCPAAQETADCKTNANVTSCPSLIYGTEALYGYCMPSKASAEKVLALIEKEMNEESNFGKYILDL